MEAGAEAADVEVVSCLAGPPPRKPPLSEPFSDGQFTVPDEGELVPLPTGPGEESPALCAWLREALLAERYAVTRELLCKHTAMLTELESRLCAAPPGRAAQVAPPPQRPAAEAPARAQSEPKVHFDDSGPPGCVDLRGVGAAGEDATRRPGWEDKDEELAAPTNGACAMGKPESPRTAGLSEHAEVSERSADSQRSRSTLPLAQGGAAGMARAANRLFKSTKSEGNGKGSERQQKLRRLVKSTYFELFSAMIIALTTVFAALEVQYTSFQIGYDLEYRWFEQPSERTWPGGATLFDVMDYVCGALFTLEVVMKALAFRQDYVRDGWNLLDFSVTICWYMELLGESAVPIDPTVLRMGRLVRLFRLLKLAKKIEGFDSLYLMTTAVRGSASSLGWSCLLLFLFQIIVALFAHAILANWYLEADYYPIEERREVFAYWGSFTRSILTTFEMTLADFPEPCRMLSEYVSEWFMVFFIVHKLTIGFAVIGVINGVFIQETFKVATTDDQLMIRQKQRMVKNHAQKMERLFEAADGGGDGLVDVEEFQACLREPDVQTWLASMDLDVEDAAVVFQLIDADGDGRLTADELVAGVSRLMGDARNLDLLVLMREQKEIMTLIQEEVIPQLGLALGTSAAAKRSTVAPLGHTRLAGIGGSRRAGPSTRLQSTARSTMAPAMGGSSMALH